MEPQREKGMEEYKVREIMALEDLEGCGKTFAVCHYTLPESQ